MKIIEALKKIKANDQKISDLNNRIAANCARKSIETSAYDDPIKTVSGWINSVQDLILDNERLTYLIHRTNVETEVTIEIGDNTITKTIDQWLYRRRNGAVKALQTYQRLSDRGLKSEAMKQTDGTILQIDVVRHFDAAERDKKVDLLTSEPLVIDARLEIINAITDLVEA